MLRSVSVFSLRFIDRTKLAAQETCSIGLFLWVLGYTVEYRLPAVFLDFSTVFFLCYVRIAGKVAVLAQVQCLNP
jgi:hypothetical protein